MARTPIVRTLVALAAAGVAACAGRGTPDMDGASPLPAASIAVPVHLP